MKPLFHVSRIRALAWYGWLALALAMPTTGAAQLFKLKERGADSATEAAADAVVVEPAPIRLPTGRAAIPRNLKLSNPPSSDNPLAAFWSDRNFVKSFAGSFGYRTDIEPPKPTASNTNFIGGTNELSFHNEMLFPLMTRDTDAAIKLLTENVTTNDNAIFDYYLGNLYFQKSEHEKAVPAYRSAIDKFPNFLRAHKNLGISLVGMERFEEAIPELTRTIELGGGDGHVYGILGVCHLKHENYIGAEGAYRNAMMLMPGQRDWRMGLLTCQIEQGKLSSADSFLETLIKADPTDARLWDIQASLFMQMEKPKRAAINYEILRKLGKASLANLMLLGDIYMSQESPMLALSVYLEAIEKDGVNDVRRSLRAAGILAASGAWDEARAIFGRIRDLHGEKLKEAEEMTLLKLESKAALASGEGDRAIEVLEKIIGKNPLDAEALLMVGDYYAAPPEEETDEQAAVRVARADHRYDLASQIEGFEAAGLVKRAQLQVRARKYDRAVDLLTQAQKVRYRDNIQRYLEAVQRAARKRS
jgi:tetratricopeptide (TPR) repeat protein